MRVSFPETADWLVSNHSPSRMEISPTLTNQQVGLSSYPAKYEHTSGIHMHPLSLSFQVFCPCLNHVCHSLPFSCHPPRFPSFPGWWPGLTALAQQGRWKLDQLQQAPAVEQPPGNPFWLQHVRQWVSPHIHIFGEDRPLPPTVAARYQDDCWKLPHTVQRTLRIHVAGVDIAPTPQQKFHRLAVAPFGRQQQRSGPAVHDPRIAASDVDVGPGREELGNHVGMAMERGRKNGSGVIIAGSGLRLQSFLWATNCRLTWTCYL